MKVTKFVKEAIERRVREAIEKKYNQIEELKEKASAYDKEWHQIVDEFQAKANQEIIDELKSRGFQFDSKYPPREPVSVSRYSMNMVNPYADERDALFRKAEYEISRKTENIIMALEFGGSKKDFDRIIAEELGE